MKWRDGRTARRFLPRLGPLAAAHFLSAEPPICPFCPKRSTPWNRRGDLAFSSDGEAERLRGPNQEGSAAFSTFEAKELASHEGNWGQVESSMDGKLEAADTCRAAIAPHPIARGGMFVSAAMIGALVGVLATQALISQSPGTRLAPSFGPSAAVAQLLAPPASAPASFADVVDVVKP